LNKPTIVIPVFKRLQSLKKLLWSLEKANIPNDANLVFRYHFGAAQQVISFIESYNWPFGSKEIIYDDAKLNLHSNVKKCAELSLKYESIILLEDDCLVSPYFFDYAVKAISFYDNEENVAQISLYRYPFNHINYNRFHPSFKSNSGVFAVAKVSSYGEVFTAKQWSAFEKWMQTRKQPDARVPEAVINYGSESWELEYIQYMVETKKYSIWPAQSLTSNQSPSGIHHDTNIDAGYFQVPLPNHEFEYNFTSLENCYKYDAFFELEPEFFSAIAQKFSIASKDLTIDLQGFKPIEFGGKYWLTSKPCKNSMASFSDELKPVELNVIWENEGKGISLCRIDDLVKNVKTNHYKNAQRYFAENTDVGLMNFLRYKWLKYVERKKLKK
jgi:hypothetical protein